MEQVNKCDDANHCTICLKHEKLRQTFEDTEEEEDRFAVGRGGAPLLSPLPTAFFCSGIGGPGICKLSLPCMVTTLTKPDPADLVGCDLSLCCLGLAGNFPFKNRVSAPICAGACAARPRPPNITRLFSAHAGAPGPYARRLFLPRSTHALSERRVFAVLALTVYGLQCYASDKPAVGCCTEPYQPGCGRFWENKGGAPQDSAMARA